MEVHRDDHEARRDDVALYVLGALTRAESASLEAHLARCVDCAALARELRGGVELLVESVEPVAPPSAVRQRIVSEVRRQTNWPRVRGFGVAASLVLAAVLGTYAVQLRSEVRSLEVRLRDATIARAAEGDRRAADAGAAAADSQRQLAVLTSVDVARIDLKGQPAAPGASGRAYWSRATGLVVRAADLPASPSGRAYQVWVIPATGAPISESWLFKPDASGRVVATFATPRSLPPPAAVAVTLEPDGGTPAPTGAKYLVGTVN